MQRRRRALAAAGLDPDGAAERAWFGHPRLLDRLEVLHVSRTLAHLHLVEQRGSALRPGRLRAVRAGMSHLRRQLASR
jgi:hypothetical protein